jgi:hypothetical protein
MSPADLTGPATTAVSTDVLDEAREKFYPDWWMFDDGSSSPLEPRAAYRVVVRTEAERDLAYKVKPASVDAEIILETA